jgi:hypothetical protein
MNKLSRELGMSRHAHSRYIHFGYGNKNNLEKKIWWLTPIGLRVFLLQTAFFQPLSKASPIVKNWIKFCYFQLKDLVANFYVYMLIHYHL